METFRERLLKLKNNAGLTKENLAWLLDISMNGIEALESGYVEPNKTILERLAQIFNVSLGYIALLSDDPECNEDLSIKEVYLVASAGGDNGIIRKSDIMGTVYMNKVDTHGKEFCAIIMKDDSMCKARIFKGDTLLVRKQSHASNGDIAVCLLENGEEIVRRFSRVKDIVTLTAEGDNFKFPAIKIDVSQEKFKVIGIVTEVRIKV